ncbi:hypothetical protein GCM10018962_14540 [Dactylosporangium matsuzakiense]|uniref:Uncharacterized protein n=1 Tax=Dactylosporangium matsuzakiense TaxID=53360 RepID=A0A9W6KQR3_9ACTN|nr:hypothetical protein GCM10017581_064470 [Dactylosporangium matsuzakiense]
MYMHWWWVTARVLPHHRLLDLPIPALTARPITTGTQYGEGSAIHVRGSRLGLLALSRLTCGPADCSAARDATDQAGLESLSMVGSRCDALSYSWYASQCLSWLCCRGQLRSFSVRSGQSVVVYGGKAYELWVLMSGSWHEALGEFAGQVEARRAQLVGWLPARGGGALGV